MYKVLTYNNCFHFIFKNNGELYTPHNICIAYCCHRIQLLFFVVFTYMHVQTTASQNTDIVTFRSLACLHVVAMVSTQQAWYACRKVLRMQCYTAIS